MKQEEDNVKEPGLINRQDRNGCLFRFFIFIVVPIVFILVICSLCTRRSNSDYDDRWDYLDHKVKSEPYYKQWD